MTVGELLTLFEQHPFILYYYSFSMVLSIILGRFFLRRMGHPRIWNYFFSLLLYTMTVFGIYSLILFIFQLITHALAISIFEILIPFFTMIVAIWMIRSRVNINLLTGFGNVRTFFIVMFILILFVFLFNYWAWLSFSKWPVYLFLLFLVVATLMIQQMALYINSRKEEST